MVTIRGNLTDESGNVYNVLITTESHLELPIAPALSVVIENGNKVHAMWVVTPDDPSITSYKLYLNGILNLTTSGREVVLTTLTPGVPTVLTVRASNSAGDSPVSNAVTIVLPLPTVHFRLGAAGTGVGNGSLGRWMSNGPDTIEAAGTWSDSESNNFSNVAREYGTWNGILDVAVGGIYSGTWADGMTDARRSYWESKLGKLKTAWGSRDPKLLRVRFAHEFNGNWYKWSVKPGQEFDFAEFFKDWVDILRSKIPGALAVWSPNRNSSSNLDLDKCWPGNDYADRVGVDTYNNYPHCVNTQDIVSHHINDATAGLEAWRQRCIKWGTKLCLSEVGNPAVDSGGGAGGGDAPEYFTVIHDWCRAHADIVEYAIWFNIDTGYPARFQFFDGSGVDNEQPQFAARFRAASR